MVLLLSVLYLIISKAGMAQIADSPRFLRRGTILPCVKASKPFPEYMKMRIFTLSIG